MVCVCTCLYRLSNSEGNPVDDVELIRALQASKAKSQEIEVKMMCVETLPCNLCMIELDIDHVTCTLHTSGQSGIGRADREGH